MVFVGSCLISQIQIKMESFGGTVLQIDRGQTDDQIQIIRYYVDRSIDIKKHIKMVRKIDI